MVAEQVVDLGWRPRAWQHRLLMSWRRFNVWVCARQIGKTEAALMKLIDAAIRSTETLARFAYIAPTRVQARSVAWDRLKAKARRVPGVLIAEGELSIKFPHNGAVIRLYGADDPDSLRGHTFRGIVVDEVSDHARRVWGEILLPTLAAHRGWALFVGTPRGLNLLSDLFYAGQQDPEFAVAKVDVYESGVFSAAEIEALQRQCSVAQWAQEFLCDFNASSTFLTLEALMAVTVSGRTELPRRARQQYFGFTDLSSGAGGDSAALAIGHSETRGRSTVCVVDVVREVKPPFSVAAVCREFAKTCRAFDVVRITGDRFGSEFAVQMMRDLGITLWPSERTKSELYLELLPAVNSKRVELLDLPLLRTQLAGLDRRAGRGGREFVDHASGDHDDVANVIAGVVCEVLQPASAAFGVGQAITADRQDVHVEADDLDRRPSWVDVVVHGKRYVPKPSDVPRRGSGKTKTHDSEGFDAILQEYR